MDHFAEVEEYFDGDPRRCSRRSAPRARQRQITNRMGDFNAILDFPPAPKLGPLEQADPVEGDRGRSCAARQLFHGKAQCAECHSGPAFVDDYLHDLQVERFYAGRPEGPIKTFPLRGIKDSPPYLHDGRLPTLHDTVEFFNLVLELNLTKRGEGRPRRVPAGDLSLRFLAAEPPARTQEVAVSEGGGGSKASSLLRPR